MVDKKYYTERINKAGPVGLVALNFELTLDFLQKARKMYDDREQSRLCITRAREGIENLIQSLDFDVQISHDFYKVYEYTYKLLCDVQQSNDKPTVIKALDEAVEIINEFAAAWRKLADQTVEEPIEEDAPKIYTGLTYDKDGKATEYIEEPTGGYKA